MNSAPKISVIMPIYNAEKFLQKAVTSIIEQDFKDIEIILVNDGSTDASKVICEEFKNKDSRIKVINKSNGGVASARNEGLKVASGDYIIHADSDDFVLPNAYTNLYKTAKETNADIIIGDYFKGTISNPILVHHDQICDASDFTKKLLLGVVHGSLWNKLIKKQMYVGMEFIKGIDFMEDLLIIIKMIKNNTSAKIAVMNMPVYHYVLQPQSYTNDLSLKYLKIGDKVVKSIDVLLIDNKEHHQGISQFKLFHKLLYVLNTDTKVNLVREIFPEVNSEVWKSSLAFKYKVMLAFEICNIHAVTKIFKYLKRI